MTKKTKIKAENALQRRNRKTREKNKGSSVTENSEKKLVSKEKYSSKDPIKIQLTKKIDDIEIVLKKKFDKFLEHAQNKDSSGIEKYFDFTNILQQIKEDESLNTITRCKQIIEKYQNLLVEYEDFEKYLSTQEGIKISQNTNQHIGLLVSRHLYFEDIAVAYKIIQQRGYYRLSGYLKEMNDSDNYANHSFSEVIKYYDIDVKLRAALIPLLERVETSFKSTLINWFVRRYEGSYDVLIGRAYVNPSYFADSVKHAQLMTEMQSYLYLNRDNDIVTKYHNRVDDHIPFWCVAEIINLRWFTDFLQTLSVADQQAYVETHYVHLTWQEFNKVITHINYLRNSIAHHNQMYKREWKVMLKFTDNDIDKRIKENNLFAYIICIIRLIDDEELVNGFINELDKIQDKYDKNNKILKAAYDIREYRTNLREAMGYFIKT